MGTDSEFHDRNLPCVNIPAVEFGVCPQIFPKSPSSRNFACVALLAKRQTLTLGICLLLSIPTASGQSRNEFGSWVGVSAGTPTLIGRSERVSFTTFAVRYSRTLLARPALELRYTLDAMPVVRLNYLNEGGALEAARGGGISPLGFEVSFRPGKRVEPAIAASGGFVHFDKSVPHYGRRLNFSGDLGAGVRIGIHSSVGVRLAYKYLHLSNAYSAQSNPGFDAHLLIIGMGLRR